MITSNNTGDFYRFINRKLSCKSGIGALRDSTSQRITDDKERTNMLNAYLVQCVARKMETYQMLHRVLQTACILIK